jgi:hypothetical protein
MKIRKDLVIAVLATFCLTLTLFTIMPIRSLQGVPEYDPWKDLNDDGVINMLEYQMVKMSIPSLGDPTKNVTVTNMPGPGGIPIVTWYIYSAPFIVCNNNYSEHPNPYGVGPGVYEIDILVHNPSASKMVNITKKLVEAFEEPSPGEIHPIGIMYLPPDGAFRIDSPEIMKYLPPTGLHKGYVVLIANSIYLDVVAVQTVTNTQTGGLITNIETLTISPKPYA